MLLEPTVMLPKFREVALAESCRVAVTPEPLKEIAVGDVGALLTSARLLVNEPLDAGEKLSVNEEDWPGASVNGRTRPVRPKPVPGPADWVTLRLALPGLLSVTVWVLVTPTATLPKFTLPGTTEINGCTPAALSGIVAGEFGALLTSETLPLTVPATAGAKVTAKAADWPGPRVSGNARPLRVNPVPTTAA